MFLYHCFEIISFPKLSSPYILTTKNINKLRSFRHLGCPVCRTKLQLYDFPHPCTKEMENMPLDHLFKTANKLYEEISERAESQFRQISTTDIDPWNRLSIDENIEVVCAI